jgi:7-cyano-7-deazaguanine reductase
MDAVDNENYAEGKKFKFEPEETIDPSLLKMFQHPSMEQYIKTVTHEFSAVCPFSGLPDLATVIIEYYPRMKLAVELKSLKYYLLTFRNVGIYQEGVTKRIYDDMRKALGFHPYVKATLRVTTHYHVRGGFYTTCIEGEITPLPQGIIYPENF